LLSVWCGTCAAGAADRDDRVKIFQDGQLDELNLLFYASTASFVCLLPAWLWTDGWALLLLPSGVRAPPAVLLLLAANGVTHFGQNVLAFTIMTLVSPVTYSIASLFKRVVIILSAIAYFETPVTALNGVGLALTFAGLYMYNHARDAPSTSSSSSTPTPTSTPTPAPLPTAHLSARPAAPATATTGYGYGVSASASSLLKVPQLPAPDASGEFHPRRDSDLMYVYSQV
jgi:solute carrier family 35, member E1